MTRSGTAFQLPPLAPIIVVTGSGLLPTPSAVEVVNPKKQYRNTTNAYFEDGRKCQPTLSDVITRGLWPTPNAGSNRWGGTMQEWGGSASWVRDHPELATGSLNPTWVEWLMGYPLGWTDLKDSATPSSHRFQNGSPDELQTTERDV